MASPHGFGHKEGHTTRASPPVSKAFSLCREQLARLEVGHSVLTVPHVFKLIVNQRPFAVREACLHRDVRPKLRGRGVHFEDQVHQVLPDLGRQVRDRVLCHERVAVPLEEVNAPIAVDDPVNRKQVKAAWKTAQGLALRVCGLEDVHGRLFHVLAGAVHKVCREAELALQLTAHLSKAEKVVLTLLLDRVGHMHGRPSVVCAVPRVGLAHKPIRKEHELRVQASD
mmetsp:Transcript_17261/g.54942  ORF Transcript_17261/g.54942 Transcript_17261/m.54942 type:complete len:226 (+) Transcript_17261:1199-1876(+)